MCLKYSTSRQTWARFTNIFDVLCTSLSSVRSKLWYNLGLLGQETFIWWRSMEGGSAESQEGDFAVPVIDHQSYIIL